MCTVLNGQITLLLERVRLGDGDARAMLLSVVYPELRKIAAERMRAERPGHTLQPTALVHEVFVRMAGSAQSAWQNRSHFFAVAAALMREILVDYARRRRAVKRGAGAEILEIEEWQAQIEERPELIIEIDRLLARLSALDERQAKIVEMRYFSGLTEEEIAEVLGISQRTVKRDWAMARAWMHKELSRRPPKNAGPS